MLITSFMPVNTIIFLGRGAKLKSALILRSNLSKRLKQSAQPYSETEIATKLWDERLQTISFWFIA